MAKQKHASKAPAADIMPPAQAGASPGGWPSEFLAPGPTAIIVGAGLLTSIVIGYLAMLNGLLGVKQLLAYLLGLANPYDIGVPANSWDVCGVILGFVWVLISSVVHPALGISVLALLRPWLDGYTFPTDNMYFMWGTVLCFVIWGVRKVMHGGDVRAWRATLLFALFPLVAFLLSGFSINFNETFRALAIWPSYVILFFLIANMGASPAVFRLLIGAISVSIVMQAVFAIMQYNYILPYLRMMIQQDPSLLESVFGIKNPTAELARRFNINRAFGTVLFPNALAAFLILWIPFFAAAAWNNLLAWRALSASARAQKPRVPSTADRRAALYIGVATWAITAAGLYALFQFPLMYIEPFRLPRYIGTVSSAWVSAALALPPAIGLVLLALRRGPAFAFTVLRTSLYALALVICCYTLALTFSRGGFLALLIGAGLGAALLLVAPGRVLPRVPSALKRAVGVAMLLLVTVTAVSQNTTELSVDAKLPSTAITTQGQDVSVSDLASGASFRARFTYWRVGLSMFSDNPWTGVGLKCFGWAYPKYQYLGAYDVREAHNAYLQAYTETGIVGGTVHLLYRGGVLLFGVLRTLAEQDPLRKRTFATLTAGLAAFLAHSGLDINFSHPTLMFFASALAGLLFALAPAPAPSRIAHLAVLPALVVAALCAGIGMRVFVQDLALGRVSLLNVSDDRELDMRLAVGRHFFISIPEIIGQKKPIPGIYFAAAGTLIPDEKLLAAQGVVVRRGPNGQAVIIKPGEPIPHDALIQINKPWEARRVATEGALRTIAETEALDARFPHNPRVAAYLAEWYSMLAEVTNNARLKSEQPKYIERMIYWSEEASRRNPWHADLKANVAQTLWLAANYEKHDNRKYFEGALECMKQAVMLSPVTPEYWGMLSGGAKELAAAYRKANLNEKAAEFQKLADEAATKTKFLYTERGRLGI